MSASESVDGLAVRVERLGGIDDLSVEFAPGVTALVGRNATNRTSLLRAVAGALGGDHATLKGDADEGRVRLDFDGERYTRVLRREGDRVVASGDPYLADADTAGLFAFLFESNPARAAVRRGDDLRDLIVSPVDTERIEREIRELTAERDRVDEELAAIEELREERPSLEAEHAELRAEVERLDEEVTRLRAEAEATGDPETTDDVEAAREELRTAREELRTARDRAATEREALDSLREEHTELAARLEDAPTASPERVEAVEERLGDLRARKRSLESTLTGLQRVVEFNERVLDGDLDFGTEAELVDGLRPEGGEVTCWTCGTEVAEARVRETVDRLSALRRDTASEQAEVSERIAEVAEERDDLRDRREERQALERRLDDVADEIARREDRLAEAETAVEEAETRVATVEDRVATLEDEREDERLALQTELGDRRYERDRARERLTEVEDRIESVEAATARRADLREERADLRERIEELRTRVDRVEREAVESFNDHMAELLDRLAYDNVERVWLERADGEFGLHVVRTTGDGAGYEDTVDHLSESEREVIGLVFALAGYLVHDVDEEVPVMLVDSVEAIDGPRVARLLDYLGDRVPYVVAALLPEHGEALSDDVTRLTTG